MTRSTGTVAFRGFCFLMLACVAAAQAGQTLPKIEGESLAGHRVVLPDSAKGNVAVLIFGFTKASKEPTSAWAEKIYGDFGSRPQFEIYQLPVLEEVPRFIRGTVISGMKKGVRENRRNHFVPILQQEAVLKGFVDYREPDDAYLMLLDPSGRVVDQKHGPFDEAAYSQFRNEIQALLDRQK